MRRKHKLISKIVSLCFVAILAFSTFSACTLTKRTVSSSGFELDAFSDVSSARDYDSRYFYRNDLNVFGGDADVIYVSKSESAEYGGYFYMYTSGNDGVVLQDYSDHRSCITCLRSKDLNDWELCGAVDNGYSCYIGSNEWVLSRTWAPEVLRNPNNGKYYMYFSAFTYWNNNGNVYYKYGSAGYPLRVNGSVVPDSDNVFTPITTDANAGDNFMGAVLVSDTPVGPFRLATKDTYFNGGTNANGELVTGMTPQINIYSWFKNHKNGGKYIDQEFPIIDLSPIYTSDGKLYISFSRHRSTNHPKVVRETDTGNLAGTSCLWVMEMNSDWVTPKYETLRKIAETNYISVTRKNASTTPCWDEVNGYELKASDYFKYNSATWAKYDDGETGGNGEGHISEGPQIYEKNGRFYLCYSPRGYVSRLYDVKQAISDNGIFGPYTKPESKYSRVFGVNLDKNEAEHGMTSTGHHAFVEVEGELFCIYYVHGDPLLGWQTAANDGRVYAFDRLDFIENPTYGLIMYGNGPTNTLQFKPNVYTGLHNVMLDSGVTVSATNVNGGNVSYLNDNKLIVHDYYSNMQTAFNGSTKITINFSTPKEVSAVSVYNAFEYANAFSSIDSINFTLTEKPSWFPSNIEYVGKAHISNVGFNSKYVITNGEFTDDPFIQTGAASNVSFNSVKVNKIEINVSKKLSSGNSTIKISEIAVLGK